MRRSRIWMAIIPLIGALTLAPGAMAAVEKDKMPEKTRYKKVTGEVVSVDQNSIVIKSRLKGRLSMAVTKNTDMLGRPAKVGDRAAVNYRLDSTGMTATRIAVPPAAAKPGPKQASASLAPAAADHSSK